VLNIVRLCVGEAVIISLFLIFCFGHVQQNELFTR